MADAPEADRDVSPSDEATLEYDAEESQKPSLKSGLSEKLEGFGIGSGEGQ